MNLTTDAELAEQFGIPLPRFHELRRLHNWPCVRLGKSVFRFTPEQVEQIVEIQSAGGGGTTARDTAVLAGQTARSARRSA